MFVLSYILVRAVLSMAVFRSLGASIPNDPVAPRQELEQHSIENTSLDLDAISQSYSGLMKIKRLLHIAKHCPMLAQDATQYAVEEVKTTFNVGAFQVYCGTLCSL